MTQVIVEQANPVTLVGGGELKSEDFSLACALAPYVVAADSGADQALAQGVRPDVVIGDLDSISAEARKTLGTAGLCHISEQDSTDFDKALRAISAPAVLAVGFLGARLDHQLAVLHSLVQSERCPCILIGAHEIVVYLVGRLELPCVSGEPVSLFSLDTSKGRSTGLEWPIEGLTFHPARQIGTSNRATGPVTLEFDDPGVLLMLQKTHLETVLAQIVS